MNDRVFNHTMLRVRDPQRSIQFYRDLLGMSVLDRYDFPDMKFSLYFLGYVSEPVPTDRAARAKWIFEQRGLLELTHNWDSEQDAGLRYHDGNTEPRGFGHIGVSVSDVDAFCDDLERAGVEFVKRPQDGAMKGLAFVKDPDGYWIEILSSATLPCVILTLQR